MQPLPRATESSAVLGRAGQRAILAGTCASLVGLGLGRFAYTPLIPALVAAGWFEPGAAAYLGAANLAGYLAGAGIARRLTAWMPARQGLRLMMAITSLSLFACALPLSFLWYFVWRFAAGVAGGVLMVLAAPTVLPHLPTARRGFASGLIVTGVGLGIAFSGTVLPQLLRAGLVVTWCGLGVFGAVLTVLAWTRWPTEPPSAAPTIAAPSVTKPARDAAPHDTTRRLTALYVTYALAAVGLVPHMVFLVDFVARGLGRGLEAGALYWVLFGAGALAGPVLVGRLADRIGFGAALRLALIVETPLVALPALTDAEWAIALSSVGAGAFVPGSVTLVLGRTLELTPNAISGRAAWGVATIAFALGQAAAAYGASFLYAEGSGYPVLFALAAAALLAALVADVTVGRIGSARNAAPR